MRGGCRTCNERVVDVEDDGEGVLDSPSRVVQRVEVLAGQQDIAQLVGGLGVGMNLVAGGDEQLMRDDMVRLGYDVHAPEAGESSPTVGAEDVEDGGAREARPHVERFAQRVG